MIATRRSLVDEADAPIIKDLVCLQALRETRHGHKTGRPYCSLQVRH